MFLENIKMAFQAIGAYKLRSALSGLGIMIGVFSIIIILTIMNGFSDFVHEQFSNIGGGAVYVQKMPFIIKSRQEFFEMRKRKELRLRDYEMIKERSIIADHISPIYGSVKSAEYKTKSMKRAIVVGTNEQYPQTDALEIERGRFFTSSEVRERSKVTVVGPDVVKELFPVEDPLGKRIKLNGENFRIIGISKSRNSVFGQSQDDRLLVPYTSYKGRADTRRGLTISVKVNDSMQVDELKDELRGILRMSRKVEPLKEDNFAVNDINTLSEIFDEITAATYWVVLAISTVSLLVGGIGIMNIMVVSVTERTKEIGIRKSLGARKGSIISQFLSESAILSVLGGIPGIILGVSLAMFALKEMEIDVGISYSPFFIGFGFSLLIGVVSGLLPAIKAAKMKPVDALRTD
jgi:putative ABC transport system permease protein